MPQITHYEIMNGDKIEKQEYIATVFNQKEIEEHERRIRIEKDVSGNYDIFFHLKVTQSERKNLRLSG
jgi:hypothetical protein